MSLYGGISFKGSSKPPPESSASTNAPIASASGPAPPLPAASETARSSTATSAEDKPKPAAWSAALRFAPTTRKKPAGPASRPPVAALRSVFGTADDDASPAVPPSAAGPRIASVGKASLTAAPDKAPPPSKWSAVSRPAVEIKPFASSSNASGESTPARVASPAAPAATTTRVRRVIAVPPAMTLEDEPVADVNGFAQSAAGKKAAQMERKRNKKRGKARDDPALAFTDVPYDPARPCDYSAYKTHVKLAREQRRLEREEEERRRRREGSYSASSYSSGDEEEFKENEPANKKARFFAPPTSYDDAGPSGFAPPASYDPPSAPSRDGTAEEAYARRVAMSNPAPPRREETGDEAYQRRIAMSQRTTETGDEAYARRVALSRGKAPPSAAARPSSFVSHTGASGMPPGHGIGHLPSQRGAAAGHPAQSSPVPAPPIGPVQPSPTPIDAMRPPPPGFAALPPPPPGFVPPPGFAPPPIGFPSTNIAVPLPPQSFDYAPPAVSIESAVALTPATGVAPPPEAVDAAQAKAREIAARLSKLGGAFAAAAAPPAPATVGAPPGFAPATAATSGAAGALPPPQQNTAGPPAESDGRTFAERMMSKFGWEEGKGLGADESGMTSALSVQRAAPAASKKAVKKAKALGEAPPPAGPTGMAGRSVVVDASREQRSAEQRAQMGGEASRVVLLTNLCGPDEVDDDLPGEVAEEANRFGVVERCFVYPVPGEARDDEAVRIFLVMSGLAGGYNAVKNFDGRFFGGRTVRARFYDEKAFHAGRHDL